MADTTSEPDAVVAQPVSAPLTRAAIFLVVTINKGEGEGDAVRSFCADFAGLVRAVEFRDLEAGLSCVMGIGSDAWDRLFGEPRPPNFIRFGSSGPDRVTRSQRRATSCFISAPSGWTCASRSRRRSWPSLGTRSPRSTRCMAFDTSTTATFSGFVDGTENPRGQAVIDAALIGAEDPAFAGGSYVITQKYLHDLARMERAADRNAGAHHRPHQARRYRTGRRGQADIRRTMR